MAPLSTAVIVFSAPEYSFPHTIQTLEIVRMRRQRLIYSCVLWQVAFSSPWISCSESWSYERSSAWS